MKTKFVAALVVLASAVAGLAAQAPEREPPKAETARYGNPTSIGRIYQAYFYGVIKKIEGQKLVLEKTEVGIDQTILLEKKTKYIRDGRPSTLSALKVGEPVYVDLKNNKKTGELIAKKVVSGVLPVQ